MARLGVSIVSKLTVEEELDAWSSFSLASPRPSFVASSAWRITVKNTVAQPVAPCPTSSNARSAAPVLQALEPKTPVED
jgi:hypothetical protein